MPRTAHSTSCPCTNRSNTTRESCCRARSTAASPAPPCPRLGDAHAGARVGGLDENGPAQFFRRAPGNGRQLRPLPALHAVPLAAGNARCIHHTVGNDLYPCTPRCPARRSPHRAGRPAPAGPVSCRPRRFCRAEPGNTTSTGRLRQTPFSNATSPASPLPGQMAAGTLPEWRSQAPLQRSSTGPEYKYQRPSFVMPTGSTSYFSVSRLFSTLVALMRDTSCSLDSAAGTVTATFNFFKALHTFPRAAVE